PTRKLRRVLAGAAADLQHVAGLCRQEIGHRRPDRVVIAVKSRTVQAAIGRGGIGVSPVLDDESDHGCEAEGIAERNKARRFARVKASFGLGTAALTSPGSLFLGARSGKIALSGVVSPDDAG